MPGGGGVTTAAAVPGCDAGVLERAPSAPAAAAPAPIASHTIHFFDDEPFCIRAAPEAGAAAAFASEMY